MDFVVDTLLLVSITFAVSFNHGEMKKNILKEFMQSEAAEDQIGTAT